MMKTSVYCHQMRWWKMARKQNARKKKNNCHHDMMSDEGDDLLAFGEGVDLLPLLLQDGISPFLSLFLVRLAVFVSQGFVCQHFA
jgi:hypothetical protein